MTAIIRGLSSLAGRYDGFIVDLWGVLHDGEAAYPGTVATLEALKAAGKRVLLLSNAPRRASLLVQQMARMGIVPELYDHVLSSGEAVHQALARRTDPFYVALGHRYFHLGPPHDDVLLAGLDYQSVDIETADFILDTGPWDIDATVEDSLAVMEVGIARGLPMVCANPDRVVIHLGRPMICAGAIAARYVDMGGSVSWRGKPDPVIYDHALALLGTERSRTLCIGDGMPTDIRGAVTAGMDSVLVTRGIHAEETGWVLGFDPEPGVIAALAERFGFQPSAAIGTFEW